MTEQPAVDARITRTRQVVIEAMHRIFEEEGASGLTHQRVALKAGVGRATIYRHWPTTLDLLVDTLRDIDQSMMQPGDEPFDEWLRNQLAHAAVELALPTSRQFIALMIAEADNHTVIADLGAELIERTYRVMEAMIGQAVERGELDRKLDETDVVARTLGPIIYRTAMQRLDVTPGFIDEIVESVVCR